MAGANRGREKMTATKEEFRQQLRARVKELSPTQRQELSEAARKQLSFQCAWGDARAILFYSPLPDEIDLSPLMGEALAAGCKVALPRFIPETGVYAAYEITHPTTQCIRGTFNILEPSHECPVFPLNRLDLVLVPGVGFDQSGHRLGRGRGFYDRLLISASGVKCGVAFDEQLVEKLPVESHDVRLNYILTPTRWLEFGR